MPADALNEASDLAYEFAWRCYEELEARRHALEDKADKLMAFAGTICSTIHNRQLYGNYAALEPKAVRSCISDRHNSGDARAARSAGTSVARINLICEDLSVAGQRKLWIATTLHPLCISLEDVLDWTATWVEISFSIIIVGLLAMIPTLLGVSAAAVQAAN